jgi:hypothetical protein
LTNPPPPSFSGRIDGLSFRELTGNAVRDTAHDPERPAPDVIRG